MHDTDPIDDSDNQEDIKSKGLRVKKRRIPLDFACGDSKVTSTTTTTTTSVAHHDPSFTEVTIKNNNTTNSDDDRTTRRYCMLLSSWTECGTSPSSTLYLVQCVEWTVELMEKCLHHYQHTVERETLMMRLMLLADRLVRCVGGHIEESEVRDMLLCVALMLIKMWCDNSSCHVLLLKWAKCNVKKIAELERVYLTALKYRLRITPANVYDFKTSLRLLL